MHMSAGRGVSEGSGRGWCPLLRIQLRAGWGREGGWREERGEVEVNCATVKAGQAEGYVGVPRTSFS